MRIDQTGSCTVWPTYGFIFALCFLVVFCRNGRFSHLSIDSWLPYPCEFEVRVDLSVVNPFMPVGHDILRSLVFFFFWLWKLAGIPLSARKLRCRLDECGIVFDSREGRKFFFNRPDRPRGDPGPVKWIACALSPDVKQPVRESDHL